GTAAEPHVIDHGRLGVSFAFDVDRLTISISDKGVEGTAAFATDPTQVPARVNLHWGSAKSMEELVRNRPYLSILTRPNVYGIYERKDDSLQLCVGDAGVAEIRASRPLEFKPGGETKAVL